MVEARERVNDSLSRIDQQAGYLIERLRRAQENARAIKAGDRAGSINSLGELQGQAGEFDQECAKLYDRMNSMKMIELALGVEDVAA